MAVVTCIFRVIGIIVAHRHEIQLLKVKTRAFVVCYVETDYWTLLMYADEGDSENKY